MSFKRLFLLCSLSVVLLAPATALSAWQKADAAQASQRVKRAIKSMARAIEVYRGSGSLKGAVRHVQALEDEVTALTYILPADDPLLNALQAARNSLTHAAVMSDVHLRRRTVTDEDAETLLIICDEYGVPPGRGGRLQTGECVKAMMREARKRHREAFAVASREGTYRP